MSKDDTEKKTATRRRAMRAMAGLGLAVPAALKLAAKAESTSKISVDMLRKVEVVDGKTYTEDRLAVINSALQRNLDQFQIVRDFHVDDSVEPAPMFLTKRYELMSGPVLQKRKGA
jgi:hypothetical protein